MNYELTKIIRERGLLVEKNIFDFLQTLPDEKAVLEVLAAIERISGQRVITRSVLNKHAFALQELIGKLYNEKGEILEKFYLNFGLSKTTEDKKTREKEEKNFQKYQIFYADTKVTKKLDVQDFVNNFRMRYQAIQRILMQRAELQNLVSINKISSNRQNLSIIGIVKEKRTTKNKNVILILEDLTGEISAVVRSDREEVFSKAQEIQMDEVIAVRASGNRDILFVYDIFFPDAYKSEKVRFEEDISIAFISDIHCGSERHLSQSFQKFLNWLNSEDETAKKIKYLFVVGDTVDGTGVFPGQESLLSLKSIREQYALLSFYLKQIPKEILFFCVRDNTMLPELLSHSQ